jgi:hypothetical protein
MESAGAKCGSLIPMARSYKAELGERLARSSTLPEGIRASGVALGSLLGLGFGAKITGGVVGGQLALRVYVRAKLPLGALTKASRIPSWINGLPTDVIALGDLRAQGRPTLCGVSIGHRDISAGTLGCLVQGLDAAEPEPYILSNNHVLANENAAVRDDPILEPGPLDGGDPADPIARLKDFEPLHFGGLPNRFDAAIARVLDLADVDPRIIELGSVVSPVMAPSLYQSVRKHGRTTLHTLGAILDVSADVRVRYGTRFAFFEDQLAISGVAGVFSDVGDSGALILDARTRRAVALLFAGGGGTTFASPIQPVLDRFSVEIL